MFFNTLADAIKFADSETAASSFGSYSVVYNERTRRYGVYCGWETLSVYCTINRKQRKG